VLDAKAFLWKENQRLRGELQEVREQVVGSASRALLRSRASAAKKVRGVDSTLEADSRFVYFRAMPQNSPPLNDDDSSPPSPVTGSLGQFFLLLPASIWIANWLATNLIATLPGGTPNFAAHVIFLVDTPLALICAAIAIVCAVRQKNGGAAFATALMWNLLLVGAFWLIFSVKLGSEIRG
jgi:hypothetical protein